jgi:hypothetical protein
MVEGVNSSMIYHMNFCKCHHVPPPSTTIKNKWINKSVFWVLFNFILLFGWVGVHCGIYKKSYNISNVSCWIQTLHHASLSHPHFWYHFPFTKMCTKCLHYIHPPMPFPHLLSLPLLLMPPGKTCSFLLSSKLVKGKM